MHTPLACFDIETGGLPEAELAQFEPVFEANKTLKDPEKIAADLANKRKEWLERAALSAITGQILAMGIRRPGGVVEIWTDDEKRLLERFWSFVSQASSGAAYQVGGFHVKGFDLPFIMRRSWKHGVEIPAIMSGRFFAPYIIDLRDIWACGEHQPAGSLDHIARHLGLGGKTDSGKNFAPLFRNPETRAQAIVYLIDEMNKLGEVARRMGLRA